MMQRSDQWHALKYLRDDLTMSFACRMYSIIAMTCLINTQLFTRFKEDLKVKPWYCEDETYLRESFLQMRRPTLLMLRRVKLKYLLNNLR